MRTCVGSGAELNRRHQKRYCSVQCQQRFRQQALTELWLATGVGEPRGERSNYIRLYLLREQGRRCAICSAQKP